MHQNKLSPKLALVFLAILIGVATFYLADYVQASSLGDNLVAHYKMNDAAGQKVVLDSAAGGTNAAANNDITSVAGKTGSAISFNGTSDYVNTNQTFQTFYRTSFTINMWSMPTDGQSGTYQILFNANNPLNNLADLEINGSGGLFFTYITAGPGGTLNTDPVFTNGQNTWHMITLSMNNGVASFYFDGSFIKSQTLCTAAQMLNFTNPNNVLIGQEYSGQYFAGLIDNIMLFNKALSQTEITELYNSGSGIEDLTPPTNIGISSITVDSTSQLTITSNTAADSESGLHATPYQFQEILGNTGATSSDWQASNSYIDTGLSCGTTYTYKVRAKDANGNISDYSSTVSATTSKCNDSGTWYRPSANADSSATPDADTSPSSSPSVNDNEQTAQQPTINTDNQSNDNQPTINIDNQSNTDNNQQGQQQGQSLPQKFIFSKNLKIGMKDSDVIQLKLVLAEQGCASGISDTDYFGSKTLRAVKCLQAKYRQEISVLAGYTIKMTGYVGTGTRGLLNGR